MARVWWAKQELVGRDVALKLSPASGDEQVVGRFVREAKIIGKFHHRNIVGVVDAGVLEEEGYVFLAMELLRGAVFANRLVPNRPLHAGHVVPILIEVLRGLEVAHAAGVVHRDVKPENIFLALVTGEGVVPKIVDFGISRLMEEASDSITIDGQLLGTPSYMSPEQALGKRDLDARADLWAIGVILYEALSGRQPFKAASHFAVLRRIVDMDPTPLPSAVDPRIRAVVMRCLQKDPTERYQDAASLRADLERALAEIVDQKRMVARSAPSAAGPGRGEQSSVQRAAQALLERAPRAGQQRLGAECCVGAKRAWPSVAIGIAAAAAMAAIVGGAAATEEGRPRSTGALDTRVGSAARLGRTSAHVKCLARVTASR